MTWKWNLREAEANYRSAQTAYHRDVFDLNSLLKDFSNDRDYVIWNNVRQTVREAMASIKNNLIASCNQIVQQLTWEDQIVFVASHVRDHPHLLYRLDSVQRSVLVIMS